MVDQAPAGITLRNEHGLDCVLVAMHIEDAHEFEAHIADESDLRAAGFVRLATGSDGPTDEELLRIEHEAEREECGYEELGRITRRAIANVCLALGEQKQAARARELEPSASVAKSDVEALLDEAREERDDWRKRLELLPADHLERPTCRARYRVWGHVFERLEDLLAERRSDETRTSTEG